jgi:non-homologous end joining protein Ku
MARPIWNGTISFGLLNVPVQLHSGERSVDLSCNLMSSRRQAACEDPSRQCEGNGRAADRIRGDEVVPEDYKDEFRSKLRKIIDAQIARQSGKRKRAGPRRKPGARRYDVVDFMALLKRSLEKKGQGGATRKSARRSPQRRARAARRKAS